MATSAPATSRSEGSQPQALQFNQKLPRGTVLEPTANELELDAQIIDTEKKASNLWNEGKAKMINAIFADLSNKEIKGIDEKTLRSVAETIFFSERDKRENAPEFKAYRAAESKVRELRERRMQMVYDRIGPPEFDGMRQLKDFQRPITETENFKRWFESSKVVDEDGNPLIALHGTNRDFTKFRTTMKGDKQVSNNNWMGELGSWFAAPGPHSGYEVGNAEATADTFAELRGGGYGEINEGAAVYPVYLSIKKPYETETYEDISEQREDAGGGKEFREKLIAQGYDGIVVRESDTDGGQFRDDWIAFYPEQIKSAIGNNGEFDPSNPDIRFSLSEDDELVSMESIAGEIDLAQAEAPEFKEWFGQSKVVDAQGKPLVVYHGTSRASITEFQGARGSAGHFAFESDAANRWAETRHRDSIENGTDVEYGDGGVVYPVYLKASNIFDARNKSHLAALEAALSIRGKKISSNDVFDYDSLEDHLQDIKQAGFDAYYDFESGVTDNPNPTGIAVFDSTQIKSAVGNNGNFDQTNPDIRFSLSEDEEAVPVEPIDVAGGFDQANTPEFKAWFGESKVVDASGKPLVVYHGTNVEFSEFKKGKSANFANAQRLLGHFFAESSEYAGQYGSKKMDVYLSIKNPFYAPASRIEALENASDRNARAWVKSLRDKGYDGVKFGDGVTAEWVAFNPTQIKSATSNNGEFDPANPDILFSVSEEDQVISSGPIDLNNGLAQANTPGFKKWFGDSKVVDGNGEPMVVYHGTQYVIENQFMGNEVVGWFSTSPEHAGNYIDNKDSEDEPAPNILPVYLSVKNPLVLDFDMNDDSEPAVKFASSLGLTSSLYPDEKAWSVVNNAEFMRAAYAAGFDGVKVREGGVWTFGVDRPDQIKSAIGNNGEFDPANPDIRFSISQEDQVISSKPIDVSDGLEQAKTPEFKKWFGDSKVLDADGKPLVVYHGTKDDISEFDASKTVDGGFHFGTDAQANMRVSGSGKIIMPVYLFAKSLQRSKDMGGNWKAKIKAAKSSGHDAIVYLNRYEGLSSEVIQRLSNDGLIDKLDRMSDAEFRRAVPEAKDSYIVFRSEQIKSAIGNSGEFDPANPDIRFSIGAGGEVVSSQIEAARVKVASIILAKDTGRVLLSHRCAYVQEPETWGAWSATTKESEKPTSAALRVLQEEAGLSQSVSLHPLFAHEQGALILKNYLAVIEQEFEPDLNWESQGYAWVDLKAMPQSLHTGLQAVLSDDASMAVIRDEVARLGFPTGTSAFHAWFGESVVVDAQGKPLVVYHGTPNDFTVFDASQSVRSVGFQFASSKMAATHYAGSSGKVIQAYLQMNRPYVVDLETRAEDEDAQKTEDELSGGDYYPDTAIDWFHAVGREEIRQAMASGEYDGYIIREGDGSAVYGVVNPAQIKSATDNSGSYDLKNPDIRFSDVDEELSVAADLDDAYDPAQPGAREALQMRLRGEVADLSLVELERVREQQASIYKEFVNIDQRKAFFAIRRVDAIDGRIRALYEEADKLKPAVPEDDYRGQHQAPMMDSGAPLHDLCSEGVYPEDFYGPNGQRYYGMGDNSDARAMSLARYLRNKPRAHVTVYRAIPDTLKAKIVPGDWVTIDRRYAKDHGESALNGKYKIIQKTVQARELFTNGDSIFEWGYDPRGKEQKLDAQLAVNEALETVDEKAAFKAWFGQSKVVDEDGAPLVVYHGTGHDITEFKPSQKGWYGTGIYFTDDPTSAEEFSFNHDEGQNLVPVYLSMQKPYFYKEPEYFEREPNDEANFEMIRNVLSKTKADRLIARMRREDTGYLGKELRDALVGMGYDGIVVDSVTSDGSEYIVFESTQIKSAIGNTGAFDRSNADIRYSVSANSEPATFDVVVDSVLKPGADLRQQIHVGDISGVLTHLGIAPRSIYTSAKVIEKMRMDHGLTVEEIKSLPALLADPVMAFQSATQGGRYVLVTDVVRDGKPLVIALEPNGKVGRLDVVYVPSAYLKEDAAAFERWIMAGMLRYANKAKSQRLVTTTKLQLPGVVQRAVGFSVQKYISERDIVQLAPGPSNAPNPVAPPGGARNSQVTPVRRAAKPKSTIAAVRDAISSMIGMELPQGVGKFLVVSSEQISQGWMPVVGDNLLASFGIQAPPIAGAHNEKAAKLLQAAARRQAQAFHDPVTGTTVFIADRINQGEEEAVCYHETVHKFGKLALGQSQWSALVSGIRAWSDRDVLSPERVIYESAKRRTTKAAVQGDIYDEELVAYGVEEAVKLGIRPSAMAMQGSAEQWLAAVVESIRSVGAKLMDNQSADLSMQDLVDLTYALAQLNSPERTAQIIEALGDDSVLELRSLVDLDFVPVIQDFKDQGATGQPSVAPRISQSESPSPF